MLDSPKNSRIPAASLAAASMAQPATQVLSNSEVEDALGAKAIAELMLEVDSFLAAANS